MVALIESNQASLIQLSEVIGQVQADEYQQRSVNGVGSSIGSHVRHCLDHVQALADAVALGDLDYDVRERGTAIETSPEAAKRRIDALVSRLQSIRYQPDDVELELRTLPHRDGPAIEGLSTSLGRELAFVLHHTIHHASLIAVILTGLGYSVPVALGYAPATPLPNREPSCAR
jgi:uncharacterized damage-inducible protein DinB